MIERNTRNTGINLVHEIHKAVRERAHNNWRSMSAEVNFLLSEALQKTDPNSIIAILTQINNTQSRILTLLEANHPKLTVSTNGNKEEHGRNHK